MFKVLKYITPCLRVQNYAKKATITDMKYLNVAEKHDAAKTIAGLLSNGTARRREGYSVYNKIFDFEAMVKGQKSKMVMTSVSGHLLELAFLDSYRNWRNVDPQSLFDAPVRKRCNEDYQPIKRTLEREIRGCQGLIIWTDCDREGENIGFEIIDVCRAVKPNITVYRAVFSEITTAAVRRALQQLKEPDKRQSNAVDVRSELDLRTGASITRFQTMRLQRLFPSNIADKLISYGSCQIPTLGFVAERYKEVEAFVSEPFWKLKVIHTINDLTVDFNWARNRLFDKQACEDYLLICLADPKATVESVTVKPKSKWRPQPMDTVEMEKLGSRKLKLSAKETMTIAEKLYTKGIISYPRTETNQFSKEINLSSLVEQQTSHGVWGSFAQRVIEWGPNPRNGNKSDQAHPPIHPTKLVTNLEGNEARVYELICRHFLACVSKDAIGSETVVNINIGGEKFTATGLCIFERNYLDVYIYDKWNAKQIHHYEEGQVFEPTEISMQEGATTAPPLLTEADLIALMEKHGIGTDATHAEHINTIKERGYIGVVDTGFLVPGVIGMGLYEGYDAMELALAKPLLRAEFEADLKRICLGEKDPNAVLREQIVKYKEAYKQIMEKISAMDEKIAHRLNETPAVRANNDGNNDGSGGTGSIASDWENNPNRMQEIFKCPKCGVAPLALKAKKNRNGHFIGCLNFPDCKNVVWLPDECKEYSVLDETCTTCGPEVKLLKFKISSPYYKGVFNTPSGWYKCCLRCDAQFRNSFNIDLENVKRMGAIVSAESAPTTARAAVRAPPQAGEGSGPIERRGSDNAGGNQSRRPNTKKNKKTDAPGSSTESKQKRTTTASRGGTKTTTSSTHSTIRSYFSSSTSASGSHRSEIDTAVVDDIPLDEFFNSNDSFEDAMIAAVSTTASSPHAQAASNDDIVAAFAADNDNEMFENFSWDIAEQRVPEFNDNSRNAPIQSNNNDDNDHLEWGSAARRDRNTAGSLSNELNFSWGQGTSSADTSLPLVPPNANVDLDNYVWGVAAHRSRGGDAAASSAAKRPRLQGEQSISDDWGDLSSLEDIRLHNVKCTGCHQLAKELIVKKDGPNKGRPFYGCPKSSNACKFFQWADEPVNAEQTSDRPSTSAASRRNLESSNARAAAAGSQRSNADGGSAGDVINCNCGTVASSLTVRKDGPNKGRPFYACPKRDSSCGFFKWGDDHSNQENAVQSSWGTGSNRNERQSNFTAVNRTSTNRSNSDRQDGKKRKCGLCRQEGHTRQKCPRKAEFEF